MIAHEVRVHIRVRPRAHGHDHVVARLDDGVQPWLQWGRSTRCGPIPHPRLVQEVLREQAHDRAQVDDVGSPWVVMSSPSNFPITARSPRSLTLIRIVGDVIHEADAARAQDAPFAT